VNLIVSRRRVLDEAIVKAEGTLLEEQRAESSGHGNDIHGDSPSWFHTMWWFTVTRCAERINGCSLNGPSESGRALAPPRLTGVS